jgi:hypothetical protein
MNLNYVYKVLLLAKCIFVIWRGISLSFSMYDTYMISNFGDPGAAPNFGNSDLINNIDN